MDDYNVKAEVEQVQQPQYPHAHSHSLSAWCLKYPSSWKWCIRMGQSQSQPGLIKWGWNKKSVSSQLSLSVCHNAINAFWVQFQVQIKNEKKPDLVMQVGEVGESNMDFIQEKSVHVLCMGVNMNHIPPRPQSFHKRYQHYQQCNQSRAVGQRHYERKVTWQR